MFGQPSQQNSTNSGPTATAGGLFGQSAQTQPSAFGSSTTNSNASSMFEKPQPSQPSGMGPSSGSNSSPFSGASGAAASNTIAPKHLNLTAATSTSRPSSVLKELLESAQTMPKPVGVSMGSVNLTLDGLRRKTESMRRADGELRDANFTKAHYLLAHSGVRADEIEMELQDLTSLPDSNHPRVRLNRSTNHASEQVTGLESYLSSKKDENVLNTIEQLLTLAAKDFDSYIAANISIDWKVRRNELRESLGLAQGGDTPKTDRKALKGSFNWNTRENPSSSILAPLAPSKSATSNSPTNSSIRHVSRDKFERLALIIHQFNEARLVNESFPLAEQFAEFSKSHNDFKQKQWAEVWKILTRLTNATTSTRTRFRPLAKKLATSTSLIKSNDSIILNSKAYLETDFFNYVETIYFQESNMPTQFTPATNVNKLCFFFDTVVARNDPELSKKTLFVNGLPIWLIIFYMIRAGLHTEALDFTMTNKHLFNKVDSNFPIYLKKFAETDSQKLPSELSKRVHEEFNQQFQFIVGGIYSTDVETKDVKFDPYKYAVYKIVGKCDLAKKSLPSLISLSIEDWLWFNLLIVDSDDLVDDAAMVYESYSLASLQQKVMYYGSRYFNASSNNPLFLRTLVMVGLYENAIQYAYENVNECDAVHLAIVLYYHGLLTVGTSPTQENLVMTENNRLAINIGRLLGSYTRTFKMSDPVVASQYLILIAMTSTGVADDAELALCHEALRELIVVSRDFSQLLGEPDSETGIVIPGILERQRRLIGLESKAKFFREIIDVSAQRCEQDGRVFDAISLFRLCEEYNTVMDVLNKLLAEILSAGDLDQPILQLGNFCDPTLTRENDTQDSIHNNVVLLAQHLVSVFKGQGQILDKIRPEKMRTCELLLKVVYIRGLYLNQDWPQVINNVEGLGLVPVRPDDNLTSIRQTSEAIQNDDYDENLFKVIPSLLIMVMSSVAHIHSIHKNKRYQILGSEDLDLAELKQVLKNCMLFAGVLQCKMPRETYSTLISLESLLM